MALVPNSSQIVECLPLVKPSIILSVPVLFNRVHDGIMKKVNEGSALKRRLFLAARQTARERSGRLERGEAVSGWLALKHSLADKIVFSKIREKLGGRLKVFYSGGAAANFEVLQFFEDIGIPIVEGYGLTETSPIITMGTVGWGNRRLGCSGVPLPGLDVRIVDPATFETRPAGEDGEIVVSGPSVMVGYHNLPEADSEVFFEKDGKRFFRTGDLGRMVDGKFLKITGRIKEQFKLENGKFVVPAPCEDFLCRGRFVAQACLVGANLPFTVALVVPDLLELRAALTELASLDDHQLVQHPAAAALLGPDIAAVEGLKAFERPQRFAIVTPFTLDNQMLTPKLSLRRNNILQQHQPLVEQMYAGSAGYIVPAKAAPPNN